MCATFLRLSKIEDIYFFTCVSWRKNSILFESIILRLGMYHLEKKASTCSTIIYRHCVTRLQWKSNSKGEENLSSNSNSNFGIGILFAKKNPIICYFHSEKKILLRLINFLSYLWLKYHDRLALWIYRDLSSVECD